MNLLTMLQTAQEGDTFFQTKQGWNAYNTKFHNGVHVMPKCTNYLRLDALCFAVEDARNNAAEIVALLAGENA